MKKILLVSGLVLLCFLLTVLAVNGQVSSWRSNPPTRISSGSSPIGQRNDVSMWRNSPSREFNRPEPIRPGSNITRHPYTYYNNWGWGWSRWDLWGAPMIGFNYYSPYWYYNSYGYRQPARIYVYNDGKKDTIYGKKPIINFGLSKTNNNQMGGYFAIGNKDYFIMDFVSTYQQDNSTYFPYGTINKVDFPLIKDLKKERTLYLGLGKRIKRFGVHGMIGFGSENVYWRGVDKYGEITFPKYEHNFTTVKVGVIRDYKNFSFKLDHDPIRNYWQVGLGLNL